MPESHSSGAESERVHAAGTSVRSAGRLPDRDRDNGRYALANMDRFLDSHPEIAEQLRKDPSLVNNKEFVEASGPAGPPQQHPHPRGDQREPKQVHAQEQRFDWPEDACDRDTTRWQLANMDRFLDSHPETAEQPAKIPRS
jgi:hypothetical protein